MLLQKLYWFRLALQLRGSVLPAVLPRAGFCAGFSILVAWADAYVRPLSWPILSNVIPSIVLGLLLVFRTNTAYERFWEGRKAWGELVNLTRNLARQIWIFIEEHDACDRKTKIDTLYWLVGFSTALKCYLRQQPPNEDVATVISPASFALLQPLQNPPLRIAVWIEDYLQQQFKANKIDPYQLASLNKLLNRMVDAMGVCERILKTPMPMAYAIHLKQLLLIYSLLLPFQLVGELGYWSALIVGIVSFSLFGIEEIGVEIENPFGHDLNDLPLDAICRTMHTNIDDLIRSSAQHHDLEPHCPSWSDRSPC